MVRTALKLDRASILNPVIHLKYDLDKLALEIAEQLKDNLRVSKSRIKKALYYAFEKNNDFIREVHSRGHLIMEKCGSDEAVIVVTGRPYNLYDKRLNLRQLAAPHSANTLSLSLMTMWCLPLFLSG